jgi:hypothetical protein
MKRLCTELSMAIIYKYSALQSQNISDDTTE